jgi:IS30 family transposase
LAVHGVPVLREHKARPGFLTIADREEIFAGIARGDSNAEIARCINKDRSTIGREIARVGSRSSYRPHRAQADADLKSRRTRETWIHTKPWLWDEVMSLLHGTYSPEQISIHLRQTHPDEQHWWVSHESIYQAIYVQTKPTLRKELTLCLRSGRERRKPRDKRRASGSKIVGMVNISQRPPEVEDRAVPGHWEGDLVLGARGASAVATLVERSTRFGMLIKVESKKASHVAMRLGEEVERLTGPRFLYQVARESRVGFL